MTDEQEVDKQDEEGSGDEADSLESQAPKEPDDVPDSNFLPRQIEDDQDATWFLSP